MEILQSVPSGRQVKQVQHVINSFQHTASHQPQLHSVFTANMQMISS